MNRYEFESLITDYLDGELSFEIRKEFEDFLVNNDEAKSLFNGVKKTLSDMKRINKISTSEKFNSKLMLKINNQKPKIASSSNSIFRFSALNASILMSLFAAVFILAYSIIVPKNDTLITNTKYNRNIKENSKDIPDVKLFQDDMNLVNGIKKDSLNAKKNDFKSQKSNKIKFVNY